MQKEHPFPVQKTHVEKLAALAALSGSPESINIDHLLARVKQSPDPETAIQTILKQVPHESDTLTRKWRGVITDLWAADHPQVPLLSELPLSGEDFTDVPMLADSHAYLAAAAAAPLELVHEQQEWLLAPADTVRLSKLLPSLKAQQLPTVESEWSYPAMRRLRATLQAARLLRPLKGRLMPVRNRYERFLQLPAREQFFVLWHADTYHIDWGVFAGLWERYMHVVQEYLPILWETAEGAETDRIADRARWTLSVLEAFTPLWDEENLLDVRRGPAAALHIVQQHALPTIIDRFLLRDLFERHGLVTIKEEFGMISKFTWTHIGQELIRAENNQNLPCGLELLKDHQSHVTGSE